MRVVTFLNLVTTAVRHTLSAADAARSRLAQSRLARPRLPGWRLAQSRSAGLWRRVPRWLPRLVVTLAVALTGMVLALQVAGHSSDEVGPFRVDFSVQPALRGDSQVQIPPLGAITVDSHDGPVRLTARVDGLDEAETRTLIADPTRIEQASETAAREVQEALGALALRSGLAALAGALLLALLVFRDLRRTLVTGAVALAVLMATGVGVVATWEPRSIREPRYEGLLTNVPAVVGDARTIYDRYGEYRGELIRILTNMNRVYTNLSTLPNYEPDIGTIRVLQVTDLHLNPTSYPVMSTLVDQFQVSFVVDTGDLTDWGSEPENRYVQNIGRLGVPYVFVRGNHDSVRTAAAVRTQPNAIVLENEVRVVNGLVVAGNGSSRFTPDKTDGDTAKDEEAAATAGTDLAETVERWNESHVEQVDLMLVHEPVAAEALADSGPLVLAGHTHKHTVKDLDDDTLLHVGGSAGARGLRGLGEKEPTPLQFSLLYFSADGVLEAYDRITVSGAGQSRVELERSLVKK